MIDLEIDFEKFTTNTQIRLLEEEEKLMKFMTGPEIKTADLLGDAESLIETLLRKIADRDQKIADLIDVGKVQHGVCENLYKKIDQLEKVAEEKANVIAEVRRKLFDIQ